MYQHNNLDEKFVENESNQKKSIRNNGNGNGIPEGNLQIVEKTRKFYGGFSEGTEIRVRKTSGRKCNGNFYLSFTFSLKR